MNADETGLQVTGPAGAVAGGDDGPRIVALGDWLRFPHGMAETHRLKLLARALVESGARVHVLSLQATERPDAVENHAAWGADRGVTFEYAPGTTLRSDSFLTRRLVAAWGWTHGAWRLVSLRRSGDMDAVYFLVYAPGPTVRRYAYLGLLRALGVPVVEELNECPWPARPGASRWQRLFPALSGIDGVVAISRFLSDWARLEALRVGKELTIVDVPIVVDAEEAGPSAATEDPPLVVFAGSPAYDETVRFIFAAMREVWRTHADCRLAVTGPREGDPASRWLAAAAAEAGVTRQVELRGHVDRAELLRLYRGARALLIPLFDDTRSRARFPTKIGEYLASARPVVSTSVGEMPRHFTDGVDAVLCPAGDPVSYGRAITGLLDDTARADAIGRHGRRLAETTFRYASYGPPLREGFAAVIRRASVRRRRAAAPACPAAPAGEA